MNNNYIEKYLIENYSDFYKNVQYGSSRYFGVAKNRILRHHWECINPSYGGIPQCEPPYRKTCPLITKKRFDTMWLRPPPYTHKVFVPPLLSPPKLSKPSQLGLEIDISKLLQEIDDNIQTPKPRVLLRKAPWADRWRDTLLDGGSGGSGSS